LCHPVGDGRVANARLTGKRTDGRGTSRITPARHAFASCGVRKAPLLVPSPVRGEIGYLLQSRAGPLAMRRMGSVARMPPSLSRLRHRDGGRAGLAVAGCTGGRSGRPGLIRPGDRELYVYMTT
jgi:hypothetical protein